MTLKKPIWTEGLFVSEHHLQQQDLYHEEMVDERFEALGRPSWGVLDLQVDADALVQGQLVLNRVRAILPDGTAVNCGGGDSDAPVPVSRDIHSKFGPNVKALPVYLVVPSRSPVRGNLGKEGTSTGRYVQEKSEVADFNAGGRNVLFDWGRPEVRIVLGEEPREGLVSIQIAEVLHSKAGAFQLRDTFVPPVLRVGASEFLMASMRRIASALSARGRSIAETRRRRTEAHVEFDGADAAKMMLLALFNRQVPLFSHFAETPETHPQHVYLALAQLAGELCTFVADADPSNLPRYNYLNLGDTFEPLVARALALINTTVAERYVQIPLKRREDGMYLGRIEDASLRNHVFFIGAHGTLSDAEIHSQLPKLSKIASWNAIGNLLNQAVNGARIELEYRPSSALPVRPGVSFFRIQGTPEYWPDIQSSGTIAIYHPLPLEAMELSLFAVDPEKL